MKAKAVDYSLYLVTDRRLLGNKELVATVEDAIKGGVTVVQLREKDVSTQQFYSIALAVKKAVLQYKVPFIINDRIDVALAVEADGIHIGQSDMPLVTARKLVGPTMVIGVSVATLAEAVAAENEGADYLGVGAVFPTGTKADARSVSLELLSEIKARVNIPVVAIGGINIQNASQVVTTGVDGLAVVSAIIAQKQPGLAAKNFRQIIDKTPRE
ncbi:MAG: Thiamine-phosphate pyrophosphorylase [Firmicutes bacterium]|nr:Thiamine-phosphate pyrophosphorylase [Bacillota bacterium]